MVAQQFVISESFQKNLELILILFLCGRTNAGALIALHLSYLDDEDRPEATYGGGGDPDLGCPIFEGNGLRPTIQNLMP